jgi:hypothetical protein
MTSCQYCKGEPAPIYDDTCLPCTASLMRPFTDSVIFRRLEIVRREQGGDWARRLCEAIDAARTKWNSGTDADRIAWLKPRVR